MKNKKSEKKLILDKLEIAKLDDNKLLKIKGGTGGILGSGQGSGPTCTSGNSIVEICV